MCVYIYIHIYIYIYICAYVVVRTNSVESVYGRVTRVLPEGLVRSFRVIFDGFKGCLWALVEELN